MRTYDTASDEDETQKFSETDKKELVSLILDDKEERSNEYGNKEAAHRNFRSRQGGTRSGSKQKEM